MSKHVVQVGILHGATRSLARVVEFFLELESPHAWDRSGFNKRVITKTPAFPDNTEVSIWN